MVPKVSFETLETVLEQINRDDNLDYFHGVFQTLEEKQPYIVDFAIQMVKKTVEQYGVKLCDEDTEKAFIVTLIEGMLVPIKAIYNQIECEALEVV